MEKNIFEGAKFGDKFLTDKNAIAIYINHGTKYHTLILDKGEGFIYCIDNGDDFTNHETSYNIISHYQEPINKDKLDKLAKEYEKNVKALCDFHKIEPSLKGAYKAGFKKAMEK